MARRWDPHKHPRDRRGRFSDRTGGWASLVSDSLEAKAGGGGRFDAAARPSDARWMSQRRKDAMQPPALRVPTKREARLAEFERTIERYKKQAAKDRRRLPKAIRDWTERHGKPPEGDDLIILQYHHGGVYEGYIKQTQQSTERIKAADPEIWDVPEYGTDPIPTELNPKRPLAVYGDLLKIGGGAAVERHLRDLEQVPVQLHAIVAGDMLMHRNQARSTEEANGVGVWLSSQPVPYIDGAHDLANVRPRGWSEGKTWKDVDGAYRQDRRQMLVGHTKNAEIGGQSAALHEFGHALDYAVGDRTWRSRPTGNRINAYSKTPAWRKVYKEVIRLNSSEGGAMSPYLRQEGDAGPLEMFAEAFAIWARGMADPTRHTRLLRYRDQGAAGSAKDLLYFELKAPPGAAELLHDHFMKLSKELGVQW